MDETRCQEWLRRREPAGASGGSRGQEEEVRDQGQGGQGPRSGSCPRRPRSKAARQAEKDAAKKARARKKAARHAAEKAERAAKRKAAAARVAEKSAKAGKSARRRTAGSAAESAKPRPAAKPAAGRAGAGVRGGAAPSEPASSRSGSPTPPRSPTAGPRLPGRWPDPGRFAPVHRPPGSVAAADAVRSAVSTTGCIGPGPGAAPGPTEGQPVGGEPRPHRTGDLARPRRAPRRVGRHRRSRGDGAAGAPTAVRPPTRAELYRGRRSWTCPAAPR